MKILDSLFSLLRLSRCNQTARPREKRALFLFGGDSHRGIGGFIETDRFYVLGAWEISDFLPIEPQRGSQKLSVSPGTNIATNRIRSIKNIGKRGRLFKMVWRWWEPCCEMIRWRGEKGFCCVCTDRWRGVKCSITKECKYFLYSYSIQQLSPRYIFLDWQLKSV